MTIQELPIAEQLLYTTVRLEVEGNGTKRSGTAFFFQLTVEHEGEKASAPLLVTARHVVETAEIGRFHLTTRDPRGRPASDHFEVTVDRFAERWLSHPDENVDLCAMPAAPLLKQAEAEGSTVFYSAVTPDIFPDEDLAREVLPLEQLVLVGYPNSLWDHVHNLPVMRRGALATPYAVDFQGRSEFVIDAACVPGASGSPVFLWNMGSYMPRSGGVVMGSRFAFLGVLHAGPVADARGTVYREGEPEAPTLESATQIPIHLGYCAKAEALLAFRSALDELARSSSR